METGKLYHLYTHANGSENLFKETTNYEYFLKQYKKYISPVADTLVFCLMPNHIHFLVRLKIHQVNESETKSNKQITQPFSNLFNSYTKAYNKMYSRMGSLFIPNFKRKPIEDNDYLTQVILYIHLNPVHHGFVKSPTFWEWSSFNIIVGEEESWIKKDEVIDWFGDKEKFLRQHLTNLHPININLQGL